MCTQVNPRGGNTSPTTVINPSPSEVACKYKNEKLCAEQTCKGNDIVSLCQQKEEVLSAISENKLYAYSVYKKHDIQNKCIKDFVIDGIRLQKVDNTNKTQKILHNCLIFDTFGSYSNTSFTFINSTSPSIGGGEAIPNTTRDNFFLTSNEIKMDGIAKLLAGARHRRQHEKIKELESQLDQDVLRKSRMKTLGHKKANGQRDLRYGHAGHRDGIQLMPDYPQHGGRMDNIFISGNIFYSRYGMQGIFASDGCYSNVAICGNIIEVGENSQNKLAISGLFTGIIKNNVDMSGNEIVPLLRPLRIGGSKNAWIISFDLASQRKGYKYGTIHGVNKNTLVNNRSPHKLGGIKLINFKMLDYIKDRDAAIALAKQKSIATKKRVSVVYPDPSLYGDLWLPKPSN